MRLCTRCVLPETFPGIDFDETGRCHYCRAYDRRPPNADRDAGRPRREFEALVESVRPRSGGHCVLAYSGGKDSSYTLWLLRRRHGLRVTAVTLDNGFLSPQALRNARRVVEALEAEHIVVRPPFALLRRLFAHFAHASPYPPVALLRASSVCNACIALVKSAAWRLAIERRIPLVAYGFSSGQAGARSSVLQINAAMLRHFHASQCRPLLDVGGDEILPYLIGPEHFRSDEALPCGVNPLGFLGVPEREILERIAELGWRMPEDTDGNSTNCLLNTFALRRHLERHGFHPYAMELSELVRSGMIEREEALSKLANLGSEAAYRRVAQQLDGAAGDPADALAHHPAPRTGAS